MAEFNVQVVVDPSRATTGSRRVRRELRGVENAAERVRTRIAAAFAVLGSTAFLANAIRQTSRFQTAIAEISTLVDTAVVDINRLQEAALAQAGQFGSDAQTQAAALYQIISAGASDATEATAILTAANRLAVGGVTDVRTAADGLVSTLNAYGAAAERAGDFSDIFFVGVRAGRTTVDELSGALGRVTPLAASAGVSFEEVVAAVAALTSAGVSTNEAVTGLRGILAAIIRPTNEAAGAAQEMGVQFNAAALEANGLQGTLDAVFAATGGNTEALSQLFTGLESLTPALALAGQAGETFAETLINMENRAGATEEAFNRVSDTAGFQFNRVLREIETTIQAALVPVLEAITPILRGIADNFDQIVNTIQIFATVIAFAAGPRILGALIASALGATAAIGRLIAALAVNVVLTFTSAISAAAAGLRVFTLTAAISPWVAFTGVIGAATGAVRALTVAILINPIGLIATALATVIGLLVAFRNEIRVSSTGLATFQDFSLAVWESVSAGLGRFVDFVRASLPDISVAFETVFGDIDLSFEGILVAAARRVDSIIGVFVGGALAIVAAFQSIPAGLEIIFVEAFNAISARFTQFINDLIRGLNLIPGIAIDLFEPIQLEASTTFGEIGSDVAGAFAEGFSSSTAAEDAVNGLFDRAEQIAQNRIADQRLIELAQQQADVLTPGSLAVPGALGAPGGVSGATGTGTGAGGAGGAGAIDEVNEALERQADLLREITGDRQGLQQRAIDIQTLFDQGRINVDEFTMALRDLNVEVTALDNSFSGGFANGLARIAARLNDVGSQVSDFVVGAFDQATDAIVNFARTGEFNVRQFFQDLFSQLLRLATNQLFSQLVSGFLGGGGGVGGFLGGLFGLQNGGSFMVGGSGGPDSQLVAFRASPNERVDVSTPGQQRQRGGETTVVQAPAPNVLVQITPNDITSALSGNEGDDFLVQGIQRNARSVRQVLG